VTNAGCGGGGRECKGIYKSNRILRSDGDRKGCSGKNLNYRIEREEGMVSSHFVFRVDSKCVVVAPETMFLKPPSPT